MAKTKLIAIEGSRPIFKTNFSGDPTRDNYGNDARKLTIIIPDEQQALDMIDAGFNVKETKPKEGEEDGFVPEYYIRVNINYDTEWPPKIYLVAGEDGVPQLLDAESVAVLDSIYISKIDAVLNPFFSKKTGRWSLYAKTMYVTQDVDDDPFAAKYRNRSISEEVIDEDDAVPFN